MSSSEMLPIFEVLNESSHIGESTVLPNQSFIKVWRIRNIGKIFFIISNLWSFYKFIITNLKNVLSFYKKLQYFILEIFILQIQDFTLVLGQYSHISLDEY